MELVPLLLEISVLSTLASSAYVVSGRPPTFVSPPQTSYTSNTSSLRLNCTVDGDPAPSITWLRGNPLQPLTTLNGTVVNGTLIIPNVTEGVDSSATGVQYQCRANNSFGTILSKPINVFTPYFGGFRGPLKITYYVENTAATARDEVALFCNISSALPTPVIVWVDDQNTTVPNDGVNYIYIDNGAYLVIINVDPATTALRTYRCRVTNAYSNMVLDSPTRYNFNVTNYNAGTVFVYLPFRNVIAYDGDTNILFYVVVAGIGNTQLNFRIPPEIITRLTASSVGTSQVQGILDGPVRVSDTGTTIVCMDGNLYTQTATLTVLAPLTLTSSPSDSLYNFQGDTASFTCGYFAAPEITLSWYKDGVQLNSYSSHVQISGSSLNISSLFLNDSGMYQCSVSNGTNSIWAQWAVGVRVPKLALVLQGQSTPLVVSTGSNVTLTFQVQADPIPSVQWFFNGSLIQSNITYQSSITPANNIAGSILYDVSLLIDSVDLHTQGYYYASFSNKAGTQNISSVFVTPQVSGRILSFIAVPACITLGSTIQLVCSVYGYPIPNVTFDGVTLSGRTSQSGNTLNIANLSLTDSTKYTCRTSNGAQMSVQPLVCPILSAAGGGVVTAGSSTSIVCTSNSDLNGQSITWYKSGAVVLTTTISQPSSLTTTLTLTKLQTTDSGLYSCSVPGVSSNNVTLTVMAVSFPIGAIVGIAAGGSIALLLLIAVFIIIACCVSRGKGSYNVSVTMSSAIPDYGKGKGNVDVDSDEEDGGAPNAEAFNPQYESLPALRPSQPPSYKPTPSYMANTPPTNGTEVTKVSPLDMDSTQQQ
ncbi:hypothetical protein EMCRGX_G015803 [Ephydatia muelleri]